MPRGYEKIAFVFFMIHPSANFIPADFGGVTIGHYRRKKPFVVIHRGSKRESHTDGGYSRSRAGMPYEPTFAAIRDRHSPLCTSAGEWDAQCLPVAREVAGC